MIYRIGNMVVKEFIQYVRDPLLTAFLILLPLLQLVLMAQATGRHMEGFPLAVLDYDHSPLSRSLVAAVENTPELETCCYPEDMAALRRLLDEGKVTAGLIIPAGFAATFAHPNQAPQVQVVADASNDVAGSTALRAAEGAINDFVRRQMARRREGKRGRVDLRATVRFNPTFNFRDYTIPAQVGFIVYQVTLAVASLGLARERELGTLEQLLVTPMRRFELITGKAIPAILIGLVDFLLLLPLTFWGFKVPLRGSLGLLLGLSFLFVVAETGWGILLSSIARTQQQAILYVFVVAMTEIAFAGYLVPVENLPTLLRFIAQLSPLQHYLAILRSVMLKGTPLSLLWPRALALVGLGVGIGLVALLSVQHRLD